ncbi:SDR family oxidoreductase [Pseudoduganella sp. FT25W]|uniref:SDR family oxidoreductase n=1 Tax=Duganella alba TaxID=2666081 RepID=A0A6L5QA10_9BURK|nr:SDR family oxidoreductase [Duganella alba]MRX06644.1 SDR family oxidoreductase [Duganella alba]MRX18006.1 SDR family oxidoreductase [Duganella alba]
MSAAHKPLAGKVALVTGGARGLGAATARALAAQGADVAFTFVSPDSIAKAAAVVADIEAHGVRALSLRADQADASKAPKLIGDIIAHFGRLDIVINSASIDRFGTADDPLRDDAMFEHYWAVANGGFRAIVRAASKVMGDGGRFVFVGSNLGVRPGAPGMSDMASIKAAIDGYARGAARDLADRGITVNVVHAGFMQTDINAHMRDAIAPLLQNLCIKRYGRLEEIIAPILFLASSAASYITGAIIDADGGYNV